MTKKGQQAQIFYLWASKNLVGPGHPRPSARHCAPGHCYTFKTICYTIAGVELQALKERQHEWWVQCKVVTSNVRSSTVRRRCLQAPCGGLYQTGRKPRMTDEQRDK